jgi:hypothetical protein
MDEMKAEKDMIQKVEHPSKRLLFSPFSRSQLMAIANY